MSEKQLHTIIELLKVIGAELATIKAILKDIEKRTDSIESSVDTIERER